MKAPNDPQDFVPEIIQDPGEPLGPPVLHIPPLEDTYNVDNNILVDLHQPVPIPDNINAINVPEVATVAVPEAVPKLAPEAAVTQMSSSISEDSGTNTSTSQATDPIVTHTAVVHDIKWYKDDFVSSIHINGEIPDRYFGFRTTVEEAIKRN